MLRGAILFCVVGVVTAGGTTIAAGAQPAARTGQRGTPRAEFQRGKSAFDRSDWPRAIEALRPLLYPDIRLETEGEIVQAHRMLAVAHLYVEQNDLAAQEFRKLLQLRPDYRFDPILDPPRVVDFFNGVLREHEAEVARIEGQRREAEEARRREGDLRTRGTETVVEKRIGRNSFAVNFIPFGAGQFQNGERAKGWAFLLSESVLGAASLGAFATNFAVYGITPKRGCLVMGRPCPADKIDRSSEERSRLLSRIALVSGGLFYATVAWGIADAIMNFRPEVPLSSDGRSPAGSRRSSAQGGLRLTPTLVGDTVGPGLSFRF